MYRTYAVSLLLSFALATPPLVGCAAPGAHVASAEDRARYRPGERTLQLIDLTTEELAQRLRQPPGRATLVNVWATWCSPCRDEFPDLLAIYRMFSPRGLDLLLISTDFPEHREDALAFLRENGVDFPTFFKEGPDEPFIEALCSEWSGALPATFLFDAGGTKRHAWYGAIEPKKIARAVAAML